MAAVAYPSEPGDRPACSYEVDARALTEVGNFQHVTEASTCGFPPGKWPRGFVLNGKLGNGQPFRYVAVEHAPDGELRSVIYQQLWGCITIRIFND